MKNKSKLAYLLLGLGIGIVLSSTLYSIYPNEKYIELSDDIIIERAVELGLVNLKESISVKETSIPVEENKDSEDTPAIVEKDDYIEFEVQKGEYLEEIANNLLALGLIDDKDEFILLAEDKYLDKKFVYGLYKIKYNTSYSTIIKTLTEK